VTGTVLVADETDASRRCAARSRRRHFADAARSHI
jgi:hypothetical protein